MANLKQLHKRWKCSVADSSDFFYWLTMNQNIFFFATNILELGRKHWYVHSSIWRLPSDGFPLTDLHVLYTSWNTMMILQPSRSHQIMKYSMMFLLIHGLLALRFWNVDCKIWRILKTQLLHPLFTFTFQVATALLLFPLMRHLCLWCHHWQAHLTWSFWSTPKRGPIWMLNNSVSCMTLELRFSNGWRTMAIRRRRLSSI